MVETKMTTNAPKFLMVDPDSGFLKTIETDPKAKVHAPVLADLGHIAIKYLREPNHLFYAILVNLKTLNPDGSSVVTCARQNYPHATVLIILDPNDPDIDAEHLKGLRADGVMRKPFTYGDLLKQFLSPADLFDPADTLRLAAKDTQPTGTEITSDDQSFGSIPIDQYLSGAKAMFDLYIRLESGKYLKLLKVGDAFDAEQVSRYKARGLTHFYLKRDSYEVYLSFADKVVTQALQRPNVPIATKISQTVNHGQRVIDLIRSHTGEELKPADARFAIAYVDKVNALIKELDLANQSAAVRDFLKSAEHSDHAIAVTVLSGLLAREMGFETDKSARHIGLAAFLHDIALLNSDSEAIQSEDESKMTPEEIKIYRTHPLRGSKIVGSIRGIDALVTQAVANHHRRRDGTGFPNGSGLGALTLTTPPEIIGLADEFVRFKVRQAVNPQEDAAFRLRTLVFAHFSGDIVDKFCGFLGMSQN